jgi:glutamate/tyrosine decarboxylase-like PLP-dependent enzyme
MSDFVDSLKPYRAQFPSTARLPSSGRAREALLAEMRAMHEKERARWHDGLASGAVYHGDDEHVAFLNEVVALNSQSNPLHVDLWPSCVKFEAEIISITAGLLGAEAAREHDAERPIVGTITSGGSESILSAMKVYRDLAERDRGVTQPEIVAPTTAHAAFDKAAQYFKMKIHRVPVGEDTRADVGAMAAAMNSNTVVVVGSAPPFPHGIVDPIAELSELARERGVGFHTDACLGGFLLPFAEKLGYPVPRFDFRLPGVTSLSVDTHKYGYAAKGTSVILYRGAHMRHAQYYTTATWPGGLYCSPTMAGSRSGAVSAAAWAAMMSLGEAGYLDAAGRILKSAAQLKDAIRRIPELSLIGDPLFDVSFRSHSIDVYRLLEALSHRGWSLNGLHLPPALHFCVTLRHTQPGVIDRLIADLQACVKEVAANPAADAGGLAPIYGMAASLPDDERGVVDDLLRAYMDQWYEL